MSEKRDIKLFIVDVLVSIQKVKEYIQPFDNSSTFLHSSLHWDASMRKLEITDAISCEIEEYKNLNDINIVKYLSSL